MDPLAEARTHWEAGRVVEACQRCDAILARHPDDAQALLLAAEIATRHGEPGQGEALARRALRAVDLAPEPLLRACTQVHDLGHREVAASTFQRALRRHPHDRDLRFRWGVFLLVTGRPAEALAVADQLAVDEDVAELHALRGLSLRRLGQHEEAVLAYQAALRQDPERVEWWQHVGDARMDQRRYPEAIRAFRNALTAATRSPRPDAHRVALLLLRLADAFSRSNLIEEAWRFSEQALALDPHNARALWNDVHLLPIIYTDQSELPPVRRRYLERLEHARIHMPLHTARECGTAVASLKSPFYLHYQGGDMRPVMERYGALVDRVVRAWQPELCVPPPMPPVEGRLRVGFASWLFRHHTVGKLFGDWIRGLDRRRFEVFVYHLGPKVDDLTRALADCADTFRHLPSADPLGIARQIRSDALHALVYPEIGMASPTVVLGALRAAPVQAVAWGHPITTGLPAIDLFLSSDAMEPADGDDHYTETLVRLPGLSITLRPPAEPSERDRASFGLAEDDVVFLVPQSLFKLLPGEDDLYARILARVPRGRLVFLANPSETVTGLFLRRIEAALRARGVDPAGRVVVHGALPWEDYLALNQFSDVFLDGLTWSGGMTTAEALAMDLVPVTCPGPVMRARHTAAILTELGVTDTIADDRDDWVDLAVRVATDRAFRTDLQRRLRSARGRLYEDPRIIPALEAALEAAVQARRPATAG